MTAGLPKVRKRMSVFLVTLVVVAFFCGGAFGQEVQTESQTAYDVILGSTSLDPSQQDSLTGLLGEALAGGFLSDEEALALVNVGLGSATSDNVDSAVQALELVLNSLNEGGVDSETALATLTEAMGSEDPVGTVEDLLREHTAPPGVLNAISSPTFAAWYFEGQTDSVVLAQTVNRLFAEDVPPGILVRVAKHALRTDQDPVAMLLELEELILDDDEISWGQAACKVTGKGQNKNQEEEQNAQSKPSNAGGKGKAKGKDKSNKGNKGKGNED